MILALLFIYALSERVEIVVEDGQRIVSPLIAGEDGSNIKSWTIRCNSPTSRCKVVYANKDSPMISLTGHHAREVLFRGIEVTQENGAKANFPLLDFTDVAIVEIDNSAFRHIHRPFYHGGALSVVSSYSPPFSSIVLIHNVQFDNCTALTGGAAFISMDSLDLMITDSSVTASNFVVEKCCTNKFGITRSSFTNGGYFEIVELANPLPPIFMVNDNKGDLRNVEKPRLKRDGGSGKSAHSDFVKSEEGGTGGLNKN
jgi:hypothetical protein